MIPSNVTNMSGERITQCGMLQTGFLTIYKYQSKLEATMLTTTLSFDNLHTYGDLFPTLFRARKAAIHLETKRERPESEGMEYDQYDTPASRWIAVHENGRVLAGVRLTPTTAECGVYSYMIRDAQRGLLNSLPSNLLDYEAPVASHIWEASRVFIAGDVPESRRTRVQSSLIAEMTKAARTLGASQIIGLMPAQWARWTEHLGLDVETVGPEIEVDDTLTKVGVLKLAVNLN
jgi:acyl homoserine lactone synthase